MRYEKPMMDILYMDEEVATTGVIGASQGDNTDIMNGEGLF